MTEKKNHDDLHAPVPAAEADLDDFGDADADAAPGNDEHHEFQDHDFGQTKR